MLSVCVSEWLFLLEMFLIHTSDTVIPLANSYRSGILQAYSHKAPTQSFNRGRCTHQITASYFLSCADPLPPYLTTSSTTSPSTQQLTAKKRQTRSPRPGEKKCCSLGTPAHSLAAATRPGPAPNAPMPRSQASSWQETSCKGG